MSTLGDGFPRGTLFAVCIAPKRENRACLAPLGGFARPRRPIARVGLFVQIFFCFHPFWGELVGKCLPVSLLGQCLVEKRSLQAPVPGVTPSPSLTLNYLLLFFIYCLWYLI